MVVAADYKGPSQFVHLHNHTVFSTLDGVSTPEQYAEQCQKRGYPAMAATEHGHMGSVPDMLFAFKKVGVKFIAGCEIYFNDYEPARKKLGPGEYKQMRENQPLEYMRFARNRHLTVLAKNEVGYTNLIKLTTQAYATGFYYKPRIWFDKLCEFKEGLIILSGCLNGPVSFELRMGEGEFKPRFRSKDKRGAVDWVLKFKEAFGEDYWIETQMPGIPGDDIVFRQQIALADYYKIGWTIANDCHYLERRDFELQKVMMSIDQGLPVNSPDLFHVNSDEQYMKTRAELWERFRNHYSKGLDDGVFEKACDNTLRIAEICKPLKVDSTPKIPTFEKADEKLITLAKQQLIAKGLHKIDKRYHIDGKDVTYAEQAAIELNRIIEKGFSSYFLITHDLIKHGRERGYPFSPRGSAGGSLICHLLGISSINPLPWGLSFDRFLSPSRGGFMLKLNMPEPIKKEVA